MIEELLDFLGCYPVCARDSWLQKSIRFLLRQRWRAEENKGHLLLQRVNRLEDKRTEILSSKTPGTTSLRKRDRGDENEFCTRLPDELYEVDEQLAEARRDYSAHQAELKRLCLSAKDSAWVRDVMMSQQPQYSFLPGRDKPYYWRKKQMLCAMSGGCCAWECGCCEKPLVPPGISSLADPDMEASGVYALCTAECACCVKRNGAYVPPPLVRGTRSKDGEDIAMLDM